MSKTGAGAQEADNQPVLGNPTEAGKSKQSEERVDLDGDNDPEETIEEELEYEEIEEEEEVEEEEEEEEEVEEEVEEEEESKVEMKFADGEQGDEKRKHAELLALPPHGSEVYLGGIPYDTSEDDLRTFCELVGEVTEVMSNYIVSFSASLC